MSRRRLAALVAVLVFAAAARPAGPVDEVEPNGTTAPQALGAFTSGGLEVRGTLDPTSPNGIGAGDRDAFAFTPAADGPLRVVVDDDGGGTRFLLSLVAMLPDGPVQAAAVMGPAPLALDVPAVLAGTEHHLAVAAFADGAPVAYALRFEEGAGLPPWSGASCEVPVVASEPDDDILDALDLGDLDRNLCAAGTLATITPQGFEGPNDRDVLRFRVLLPVHVRIVIDADPASLVADLQELVFVGGRTIVRRPFGEHTEIVVGPAAPGTTLVLALEGVRGEAPVDWAVHIEPFVPPVEEEPAALDLARARWNTGARGWRWKWTGALDGLETAPLSALDPVIVRTGGFVETLPPAALRRDGRGRLRYRAGGRADGIRSLVVDPERGTVRVRARLRARLDGPEGPSDGTLRVEFESGDRIWRGEQAGDWNPKGTRWRGR